MKKLTISTTKEKVKTLANTNVSIVLEFLNPTHRGGFREGKEKIAKRCSDEHSFVKVFAPIIYFPYKFVPKFSIPTASIPALIIQNSQNIKVENHICFCNIPVDPEE